MKKKMNYLTLLLLAIFMVGCTDAEEASTSGVATAVQEEKETEANSSEQEEARIAEEEAAAEKLAKVDGDIWLHAQPTDHFQANL